MMTLSDLTAEQYKEIEVLAVDFLKQYTLAKRRGRSGPESVAREPKIAAYRVLTRLGFDPLEAVEAFRDICGQVDGVTA